MAGSERFIDLDFTSSKAAAVQFAMLDWGMDIDRVRSDLHFMPNALGYWMYDGVLYESETVLIAWDSEEMASAILPLVWDWAAEQVRRGVRITAQASEE